MCRCIDSILAQTYSNLEVILVDDGSPDNCGTICDEYALRDSRIKVIHKENGGEASARNTGLDTAKGEYIGFVDSDDIIERDMYAMMMGLAEKHDADVVQCLHDRASSLNGDTRSDDVEIMDGAFFVRRMFTKNGGDYTNQVALWSKVYRRELFENITFPAGRVYEDEQETYKLCLKAKILVETPNILYHYIKRENSIITGVSAKKMLDKQLALLDRMHYLPKRLPELEKQCCESFLRYSEAILCALYTAKVTNALETGIQTLRSQCKRLKPWLNKYERLYIPALKWKWAQQLILRNGFEPIQNVLRKIHK